MYFKKRKNVPEDRRRLYRREEMRNFDVWPTQFTFWAKTPLSFKIVHFLWKITLANIIFFTENVKLRLVYLSILLRIFLVTKRRNYEGFGADFWHFSIFLENEVMNPYFWTCQNVKNAKAELLANFFKIRGEHLREKSFLAVFGPFFACFCLISRNWVHEPPFLNMKYCRERRCARSGKFLKILRRASSRNLSLKCVFSSFSRIFRFLETWEIKSESFIIFLRIGRDWRRFWVTLAFPTTILSLKLSNICTIRVFGHL